MKIISADERLSEKRGAKILITGPTGVGKTSLLRTLDPARTLFLDSRGRRSLRAGRAGRYHSRRRLAHRRGPRVQDRRTKPVVPADQRLQRGALRSRRRGARKPRPLRERSSSTASPKSAGSRFVTPSSSRRRPPSAPATRTSAVLTACTADRWCIGCSNCSTRGGRTSSSSPCLKASSTSSTASSNGGRRSKAARPDASSPPSSIRSSPCSGSTSAMASPCAPSCARRQTRGDIPPRIAAVGSSKSSRPTSAN